MQSRIILKLTFLFSLFAMSKAFSSRTPARVVNREELPSLEINEPLTAPKGVSSKEFYLPTYTLLRAGPVSFVRRLVDPKKYENTVYKYMNDYKEKSIGTAQGNADAYLASAGK